MFSMQSVSQNPLIATFQLLPAASWNLGRSQNGILGKLLVVGKGLEKEPINPSRHSVDS